jgi:hypothetical protein
MPTLPLTFPPIVADPVVVKVATMMMTSNHLLADNYVPDKILT